MGVLAEAFAIARGRPVEQRYTLGGPTLSWSPSGGLVLGHDEGGFERSAVALRCLMLIAQNIASLDLVTLVNGEADDADPVAALWNNGTPAMPYSARIAREVLFARAELQGQAFAYIPQPTSADPPGIFPLYGRVEVVWADGADPITAGPVGYRVHVGSRVVPLLEDEVLWLRYPHPLRPWEALAPWRAALGAVESDALASKWQRQEFRNSARPSAVIGLGDLSAEEHDAAVRVFRSRIAGPDNAGESLLVSSAVRPTVQHLGLSPAEMSFIESRTANADEVMMALGVNPDLLRAGSTYENRAAAKTALWSDTLLPKLDTAGSEIDRQLQPNPSRVTGFDLTHVDALRESVDAVYARAVQVVSADLVTIDEARLMLDLDPLPGGLGNLTLTPYRAAVGGQVAPRSLLRGGPPPRRVRARGEVLTLRARRPKDGLDAVLSAYARHERAGVKAVAALARRQEKAVLQALRQATRNGRPITRPAYPPTAAPTRLEHAPQDARAPYAFTAPAGVRMAADDLFDSVYWQEETARALEQFMAGTWTEGQHLTARRLGLSFDLFDERVLAAMDERLRYLADRVTATTRAIIEGQILHSGVAAGESIPDLADRLKAVFADLTDWRATMIARTETVSGMNMSAHEVAAASGLVVSRVWLATEDSRTRPSHVRVDGERVKGTTGTYSNGLRHPGDPTAPPAETVQCRCCELFDVDE